MCHSLQLSISEISESNFLEVQSMQFYLELTILQHGETETISLEIFLRNIIFYDSALAGAHQLNPICMECFGP
jgi:hypothetical protein